ELVARATELQQTIEARADRLARVMAGQSTDQAANLARDITALTAEYEEVDGRIRRASPRYAAITARGPLGLPEIQALLDDDAALLEFSLGSDRSYLWIVSAASLSAYELPPRAPIETAARQLVNAIATGPHQDPAPTARRLSGLLFSSAAAALHSRRLV